MGVFPGEISLTGVLHLKYLVPIVQIYAKSVAFWFSCWFFP